MSLDHHTGKNSPSELKSEREILELRIDHELTNAKQQLRSEIQAELERIAREKHEPKLKQIRNISGIVIALLVAGNLWQWFGMSDRIKTEAGAIIDQKLIGPELTNTLDEALRTKAVPFIAEQLRPITNNISALATSIQKETNRFTAATLKISDQQSLLQTEQDAIRDQLRPLSAKIVALQSSVDTAQTNAIRLQDEQKLSGLLNRAELYDGDAIQQLRSILSATNGTNEGTGLAEAMFNKLQRTLLLDKGQAVFITASSSFGGPLTSDEMARELETNVQGSELDSVVNTLGKKPLFVPRLVELAHQSKDLWSVNRIAKALNEMTGVSFYPWDLQPLDSWWAQNKQNYTNWPYDRYSRGFEAFQRTTYDQALTNFTAVLAIDPDADECRALAVACAIECGQYPEVEQLNTNYAIPNGRWQRWAQAKIVLATNETLGTEDFASLSKDYPQFDTDAFVTQRSHILRQINWKLYQQLTAASSNTVSGTQSNVVH